MTGETFVLLSGVLTFGVPIVLAVIDVLNMGPTIPRGGDGPPPPPVIAPPTRPLPDCLLPRPVVRTDTRVRVLEDA